MAVLKAGWMVDLMVVQTVVQTAALTVDPKVCLKAVKTAELMAG